MRKIIYLVKSLCTCVSFLTELIFRGNQKVSDNVKFKKLKKTIEFAWDYIPFYREFWIEHNFSPEKLCSIHDLKLIPIIDKNIIRENLYDLLAVNYDINKLTLAMTGGTTGMPMKFYIDNYIARAKELAYQIYGNYKYFGYKTILDKTVVLRGEKLDQSLISAGIFWKKNKLENSYVFSSFHLTQENYFDYIKKIIDINPRYIRAYPSSIVALCLLVQNNYPIILPKLKGVICSSENIHDWQRKLVKDVLGVQIYSYYGHSEKVFACFQCKNGKMAFEPLYGFVEILDGHLNDIAHDKEIGEVVVTSFDNFYFPFIRYRTDDFVEFHKQTEKSDNGLIVNKIIGRKQEFLYDSKGDRIIFTCSDEPFWNIPGVLAYQYQQETKGQITLLIKIDTSFLLSDLDVIKVRVNAIFNSFEILIEIVDDIPRTKSGKFNYLIQKIKI